ncbi:histidine phosphatase family protein [Sinanaerobacter chloroacetimidivorans]|uniref:Histidine phosphatase family protein n=1 Tax=Sinanaerobacter chloroacetimidivorans TaxID=2818044 RepID=A0A8J8B1U8_9FIRM|nr:histidine phosphatase family protein [Sinanaerobacter chloroacetimidivorans]MBR0599078.1 histidine phosphatase family protein [Sinanaerobacter chloroacetimidivorans]
MSKIHLIRHGTTEANIALRYYGSTDLPLANQGVDGISQLVLKGIYPSADGAFCYTTGLMRTEQTFFLIYGCREHQQIAALREYHFGDFEMKSHNELEENQAYLSWIQDREGLTPCPNGESPKEFRARVKAGFEMILGSHQGKEARDRKSIIVCHGGVISIIMEMCFPNEGKNVFQWQPEPGRGYTISLEEGKAVVYEAI